MATPIPAKAVLEFTPRPRTLPEIAFKVGVNQGRVNEVIKRGKWLDDDPHAPEAVARDKAKARMRADPKPQAKPRPKPSARREAPRAAKRPAAPQGQLAFGDL
ncbi:conserved hypothetical protein [Methylorubrum populi BJ001]|uniref:RNA polymerase subunit sigma-70 n=1 Tax=Methylorubrum populi (strain ATCC BAA-705 / NCIMB 13946 / BJ001) TaxID=441620 RepID=B1Z7U0_METPB|nr:conserved hypothetical protein [Methylorubrum populi BJ001]